MKKIMQALLFILLCSFSAAFAAENNPDFNNSYFARIPILHEGRIKPLDSFARIYLRQFSGSENLEGMSANDWLAEALFDPSNAMKRKIFLVNDETLKQQLGLPKSSGKLSLTDLQPGIKKTADQIEKLLASPDKDLTSSERKLLQIHENSLSFLQLLRSFSLMLPLNIAIPEKYKDLIDENPNYIQLSRLETQIIEDLKTLTMHKGENYDYYTPEEKALSDLAFQLQIFRTAGEKNNLLRLIPGKWENSDQKWFAPWELVMQGHGSPDSALYFEYWRSISEAYRNKNEEGWKSATKTALTHIKEKSGGQISPLKLQMEITYNVLKPLNLALYMYVLCIAFLIIGLIKDNITVKNAAIFSLGFGTIAHTIGIMMRIAILSRPPVGTLYESLLFVGLICALPSFLMALRSKNNFVTLIVTITGAFAGGALLSIAPYLLQTGENMEMLVAVLNTNFWLATHVICITIGYGTCILAALIAHGYMALRLMKHETRLLGKISQLLYKMTLIALLFTAVGTALGGIWADQSWGRFWGWDPKENGALLIVLWLIWIQHGRHSGKLRNLPYAALTAYLNVVVSLAWFGVNLMNVGLHSYGFTSGAASALLIFCSIETILIGSMWFLIRSNERQVHAT